MDYYVYQLLNFMLVIIFVIGFVAIIMWFKKKEGERKSQVLLNALEKGQSIDAELLNASKSALPKVKFILIALLIGGIGFILFSILMTTIVIISIATKSGSFDIHGLVPCFAFLAIGVAMLGGYGVGIKMLRPELEAEKEQK